MAKNLQMCFTPGRTIGAGESILGSADEILEDHGSKYYCGRAVHEVGEMILASLTGMRATQ